MRRLLRLAPALVIFLMVFCLASFVILGLEGSKQNIIESIITLFYFSNWARAFFIFPLDFLSHTWSLSIEEQFYILWPALLLLILRTACRERIILYIIIFMALLSWLTGVLLLLNNAPMERLYNGLDTRVYAIMIGCALGITLFNEPSRFRIQKTIHNYSLFIKTIPPIVLLILAVVSRWDDPNMYYFGFFFVELMTVFLILDILLNEQSIVKNFLALRWIVWFGSISYGLYLWHYVVYRTMTKLDFSGVWIITLGSFITILIATISYYSIEKPILKYKVFFSRSYKV